MQHRIQWLADLSDPELCSRVTEQPEAKRSGRRRHEGKKEYHAAPMAQNQRPVKHQQVEHKENEYQGNDAGRHVSVDAGSGDDAGKAER